MKTWVLLLSLLVCLVLVGILVGVVTWHMAYEEASLRAAIGQQQAIENGKQECKGYIRTILKHQGEYIKEIKAGFQQQKTQVNIGILGLQFYDILVANEAVKDIMKSNLSRFQYEVFSLLQSNKTLIEQMQELHLSSKVNVFIGLDSEHELIQAVLWARARPDPKDFVVFITSALITDQGYLEKQTNDRHRVIQMKKSYTSLFQAALYQISKQNVDNIILLVKSTNSFQSRKMKMLNNSSDIFQVIEVVSENSTPPSQVVQLLESEIESALKENPSSAFGLFLTENYMFNQLAEAAMKSPVFSLPWFTTVEDILYDNSLLLNKLLEFINFDLSYPAFEGNSMKNFRLLNDVIARISQSNLGRRDKKSNAIEITYDSVIIASHIASWLAENKEIDREKFGKQLSLASARWAGISGLLKITENLYIDHGNYLDLHCTRNLSGQVIEYPSGIWQVRGYIP